MKMLKYKLSKNNNIKTSQYYKHTNQKGIFIDDEFYSSEENSNNNQDKTKIINNTPNTTQRDNKEIVVYENLSPQDIENLQEILESTNPDTPRIIKFHNCGSKLRVPAHKKIEITCPHCKATRRLAT